MKAHEDEVRLLEKIEAEVLAQFDTGLWPSIDTYLNAYPQLSVEISEIFWLAMARKSIPLVAEQSLDLERVLKLAEQSRTRATNVTERVRELGVGPGELARRVNLPNEMITLLQRRSLTDLPDRLILALASALRCSREVVISLVTPTMSPPQMASHFRANTSPGPREQRLRTFSEELLTLNSKGKLSSEQAEYWLDEAS